MRVLHVASSDQAGGAARAAYLVHQALQATASETGISSQLRVINKMTDDPSVIGGLPAQRFRSIRKQIHNMEDRLNKHRFTPRPFVTYSTALHSTGLLADIQRRVANENIDIVHLHWLGDDCLTIEEIGMLDAPVAWTLHDQWAFCGAEHYSEHSDESSNATIPRYVTGYTPKNNPQKGEYDLNRHTWERKLKSWKHPFHVICPSLWMSECVQESWLMRNWDTTIIPFSMEKLRPIDPDIARDILNLPRDAKLILFGADGGTADPRKGGDFLAPIMKHVASKISEVTTDKLEVVIFGQSCATAADDFSGLQTHFVGKIKEDVKLQLLYSAVDVFALPSRQDNLPLTGMEAHACGTPVVGFRIGGLPDIVADRETGFLADPFNIEQFADGLVWCLADSDRHQSLSKESRRRAQALWNHRRIAEMHSDVYSSLLT